MINKQIRTIIPWAVIKGLKEHLRFGALLNPRWPSPATIEPIMVRHDSTQTLQWRSIYKARSDSLRMKEWKVGILVTAAKVYYHYSHEEENAEGQLKAPL